MRPGPQRWLAPVATPKAEHWVTAARSYAQAPTMDGFGDLWCVLLHRHKTTQASRSMWLARSADAGSTWQTVVEVPFAWSESAGLVGRPQDPNLYLACGGGLPGDRWMSAMFAAYDVRTGSWHPPTYLQKATGEHDQYHVWDLAAAADGTLAATIGTRAAPPPPWPGPWSSGVQYLRPGATEWTTPMPLYAGRNVVWPQAQWVGSEVRFSLRTQVSSPPVPIHPALLMVDADAAGAPGRATELTPIAGPDQRGSFTAHSLVMAAHGGCSVLYTAYGVGNLQSALELAYVPPTSREPRQAPARRIEVCVDASMPAGEVAHENFALVRGPGSHVIAIYSLFSERHRALYRRTFDQGEPLEPPREIARSELAGAFARITAMRDERFATRVEALVSAEAEAIGLGVRAILRPGPNRNRWVIPHRSR